jgi:hypothetical protein
MREVRGCEADVKKKGLSSTSGATRFGDVVRGATGLARCRQIGSAIRDGRDSERLAMA